MMHPVIFLEIDLPPSPDEAGALHAQARFERVLSQMTALGYATVVPRACIGAYTDIETGVKSLSRSYMVAVADLRFIADWIENQQSVLVWAGDGAGRGLLAAPDAASIAAAVERIVAGGGAPMVQSRTEPRDAVGWTFDPLAGVYHTAAGDLGDLVKV